MKIFFFKTVSIKFFCFFCHCKSLKALGWICVSRTNVERFSGSMWTQICNSVESHMVAQKDHSEIKLLHRTSVLNCFTGYLLQLFASLKDSCLWIRFIMELVLDCGLVVSIWTVFNLKYNFHCPCRIFQCWKAVLIEQSNCSNLITGRYWYLIVCDSLLIWGSGKCDLSKQILST